MSQVNNFSQPFRIGLGQDHHRLLAQKLNTSGCPLTLGGYVIPDQELSLEANSDGDVILHALCNTLSSALGGGSLSTISDPLCQQGITDSRQYLEYFLKLVEQANYQISNLSVSLEALQPKLETHRQKITESLARILGLEVNQIGLTFTSGEGLTACGRGEGIAAQVIILLQHV